MDINEILELLIQVVVIPVIPLLALYVKRFIQVKMDEVTAKITDDNIKKQLDMAKEVLADCVMETSEIYVKSLKDLGEFDLEAQEIALQRTKDVFLEIIGQGTKEALETAYGDYTRWIETNIEKIIKEQK